MTLLHETSGSVEHAQRSTLVRVLRSTCWVFFANPLALVVAGVCLFLLGRMLLRIHQVRAAGLEWEPYDAMRCGSFMIVTALLAGIAIVHMVLMGITGWRSGRL